MTIKADVYVCNEQTGIRQFVQDRLLAKTTQDIEVSYKNEIGELTKSSDISVAILCKNCMGKNNSREFLHKLGRIRPLILGLVDFSDEIVKKYRDIPYREILPVRTTSPLLFTQALKLHASRDKQNVTPGVQNQLLKILDRIPFNLLLTDEKGHVLFTNEGGRSFIDSQDAVDVNSNGFLRFKNELSNRELYQKIKAATSSDEIHNEDVSLRTQCNDTQIVTIVLPLGGANAGAAIFMRDEREDSRLNKDTLKSLYGLTDAETNLVLYLTNGMTPAEIAAEKNVSQHTVRTQIKNIYAKTGINRQSDLIKAIITGPAALRSL